MELTLELKKRYYGKIRWIVLLRSMLCSFCMILLVLYEMGDSYTTPAYMVLVGVMVLNILYIYLLPWIRDWERFAIFQTVMDSMVAFILIYFTGGVTSIFTFVYFVMIFAWTLLLSGHASLYFASLATIFLSAITIGSYFKSSFVMPMFSYEWMGDFHQEKNKILATFFAQSLGFYAVAFLSIILSRGTQRVKILYHEILENMKEGIMVFDGTNTLVFINGEAQRLLQIQEFESKKLDGIFQAEKFEQLRAILLAQKEMDSELEMRFEKTFVTYLGIKVSLIYEGKKVRGLIVIIQDLTLKKQLQAMKRRTMRLAGIEEMALGIAHEIRNPLASIRGCVQELSREQDSDINRELGKIIISESDRLDRILQQFLDFTKPTQLYLDKIDLKTLIEELSILLKNHHQAKNLEVILSLPPNPLVVVCDKDKILQVFLNLALNGLEAGASQLKIHLSLSYMPLQTEGNHRFLSKMPAVLVEFIDNGPGVLEENRKKIFTPFFTTKSSGTGLGLPIVAKILKQHQGHIEVTESAEGGGVFKFWLPLSPIHILPDVNIVP